MSMTKKQKEKMIPIIRKHLEELEKDLKNVQSEMSKKAISKEIEERKEMIEEYQKHIDNLIDGRTSFYRE